MKHKGKDFLLDIGNLYGTMLDRVITEKAHKFPKDTFEQVNNKKQPKKKKAPFVSKKSGPAAADGVKPVKKADAKFSMSSEKIENETINTHMSKNFDKLITDVMADRLQLEENDIETIDDVTASPESGSPEGGAPEGVADADKEIEELSPVEIIEHIKTLLDHLATHLEGGELGEDGDEHGEGGEDLEGSAPEGVEDNEEKKEDEEEANEATHLEELKPSAGQKLQSKTNKVPGNASKVAGGKANAKVTDEVGTTETGVHPLVSPERMNKGLTGKNNKVAGNVKQGRQIGT